VIAYQAPVFVFSKPSVTRIVVAKLAEINVDMATLYVPPLRQPRTNAQLAQQFGL
jgi:hypothetical protein